MMKIYDENDLTDIANERICEKVVDVKFSDRKLSKAIVKNVKLIPIR